MALKTSSQVAYHHKNSHATPTDIGQKHMFLHEWGQIRVKKDAPIEVLLGLPVYCKTYTQFITLKGVASESFKQDTW